MSSRSCTAYFIKSSVVLRSMSSAAILLSDLEQVYGAGGVDADWGFGLEIVSTGMLGLLVAVVWLL